MKPRPAVRDAPRAADTAKSRRRPGLERVIEVRLVRFVPLLAAVLSRRRPRRPSTTCACCRAGSSRRSTPRPARRDRPPLAARPVRYGESPGPRRMAELRCDRRPRRAPREPDRSTAKRGAVAIWSASGSRKTAGGMSARARRRLLQKDLAGFVPAVRRMLAGLSSDASEALDCGRPWSGASSGFRTTVDQADVGRDLAIDPCPANRGQRLRYSIELAAEVRDG